MTNLLNPYRHKNKGALPSGAIAHLDFFNRWYYAGGAQRPIQTLLGGVPLPVTTDPAFGYTFDKSAIDGGRGMEIDWRTIPNGGNVNRPDAVGSLLSDADATIDSGLTIVLEIESTFFPSINMLMLLEGNDANTTDYYVAFVEAGTRAGLIYDSETMFIQGPNLEILDGGGSPVVNKFAICLFRDEGGGNFGCAASINGNTAFSNTNVGIDGSTIVLDTLRIGHVKEWSEALGPDEYVRTFTLYGAKSDAELEALSDLLVAIPGSLAATDIPDLAAFSGDVIIGGDLAGTDSQDAAAFTGYRDINADLAATDAADSASFTGYRDINADLAATDQQDVAAFTGGALPAPDFESGTLSQKTSDTGSTLTVNMPATRPDGDLFVALCGKDGSTDFSGVPGNWNSIHTLSRVDMRYHAWWWIGSSEPATYSITTGSEQAAVEVVRISGANATTPIDNDGTAQGSSSSPDCPSITAVDKALVLRAAIIDEDRILVSPATEIHGDHTSVTGGVGYGFSYADGPAGGGATGVAEFLAEAGDDWCAGTISIKP